MNTVLDEIMGINLHEMGCGCRKCRHQGEHTILDEIWDVELDDELSSKQVDDAVSYNNRNAQSVGWANRRHDIVEKVLKLNYTPDDRAFAQAVADWQRRNGLLADGMLGPTTWGRMQFVIRSRTHHGTTPGTSQGLTAFRIEDYTHRANHAACSRTRGYNCRSGIRPLSQIDSIVLHQTAGSTSTNVERFLSIPIHYVVLSNGRIIQLYPETDRLNHANKLNARSVGIEFAGSFPNDRGQCWWDSTTKYVNRGHRVGERICADPTHAQILAGRYLVTEIIRRVPSIGHILAHRQSSASRSNDPGPAIWLQVGEWAKRNLGIVSADSLTVGDGKTIPDSWKRGTINP